MVNPNPVVGTGIHALGGISAATCYLPFQKIKNWSWNTFWLVQAFFAWILVPILLGWATVPDYFSVLSSTSGRVFWGAFLLGGLYGFGGMSFGFSIKHIGYSLTYTIAIGISAVFGTIIPLMIEGGLFEYFSKPGGGIVLTGMMISMIGVSLCGYAGFGKEKELNAQEGKTTGFNMKTGLVLSLIAGFLSAVFNVSLEWGRPISDLAAQHGAGHFEGNAKLIVTTSGCFVVNFFWFVILSIKQKTIREFSLQSGIRGSTYLKNVLFSGLAGSLWIFQFFFYGLGHVKMGNFQFISWVLHMSMLIFFSYIVGMVMKEWKSVSKKTFILLICALFILVASFIVMTVGSVIGERAVS